MNDAYFTILEFLEQWGIDRDVEIGQVLFNLLTQQINVDPDEAFDSVNSRIERLIDVMEANEHIAYASQLIKIEVEQPRIAVQARLTFLGFQYLNEHRLRISTFNLNATLENNSGQQIIFDQTIADNSDIQATASRRQTTIFRWTAGFAFGAMAIAGVSLWKDFHKDKLLQSISQKDSLIHTLQKNQYRLKTDSSRLSEEVKTLTKKK